MSNCVISAPRYVFAPFRARTRLPAIDCMPAASQSAPNKKTAPSNGFPLKTGKETPDDVRQQPQEHAPVEDRRRQRLDRIGARILRLLHLRDRGLAGLSANLL